MATGGRTIYGSDSTTALLIIERSNRFE
jgi:hypothetical protein